MNTPHNDPRVPEDPDLDSTDTLPMLGGDLVPADLNDAGAAKLAFTKTATLDLPRLAKTLRSVESRIEQQGADHAALARSFERTLEMEEAAVARASALAAELAGVRSELDEARTARSAAERAASEKGAAFDALHARLDDAAREVAFHVGETRSLRELVTFRDVTIAKALDGLRERDAEVAALRAELAKLTPPEAVLQAATGSAEGAAALAELPIDADASVLRERIAELDRRLAAQAREIVSLQAAATTDQEEKAVLLAHLQAARHPQSGTGQAEGERSALQARLERSEAYSTRLLERLEEAIERLNARSVASLVEHARAATSMGAAEPAGTRAESVAMSAAVSDGTSARSEGAPSRAVVAPEFNAGFANGHASVLADSPAAAASHAPAGSPPADAPSLDGVAGDESLRRSGEFSAFAAAFESDTGAHAAAAAPGATSHGAFSEVRSLAQLLRIDGGGSQAYALRGRMLVGRSPDAELHIDSSTVSRQHAILECDSFGVLIEDTQSTNGTYVNGTKITRQRLKNGDQVKIGEATFRFLAPKSPVSTH
jgi:hypothetical protein